MLLNGRWTGKPSDFDKKADLAAEASGQITKKEQLSREIARLEKSLAKATRRAAQAKEAEEVSWATIDAASGAAHGGKPAPLPPIARRDKKDPRNTRFAMDQGPALRRGLAAFRLSMLRLEQRWISRRQHEPGGSTSGAPPGVLALAGKLPYPGDPPAHDVHESLWEACIPWHLEAALDEFDRLRTRPPSPRDIGDSSNGAIHEFDAHNEVVDDVEHFAMELLERAATRI